MVNTFPDRPFSHILAGDVFENLIDLWEALGQLYAKLQPRGKVIASIPNIRNFSFFGNLIFLGSFRHKDSGVLDRTQLRSFFGSQKHAAYLWRCRISEHED